MYLPSYAAHHTNENVIMKMFIFGATRKFTT